MRDRLRDTNNYGRLFAGLKIEQFGFGLWLQGWTGGPIVRALNLFPRALHRTWHSRIACRSSTLSGNRIGGSGFGRSRRIWVPGMRQNPGLRESVFFFFCRLFFAIWAGAGFLFSCLGGGGGAGGLFVFLLFGRAGERACFCLAVWTGR